MRFFSPTVHFPVGRANGKGDEEKNDVYRALRPMVDSIIAVQLLGFQIDEIRLGEDSYIHIVEGSPILSDRPSASAPAPAPAPAPDADADADAGTDTDADSDTDTDTDLDIDTIPDANPAWKVVPVSPMLFQEERQPPLPEHFGVLPGEAPNLVLPDRYDLLFQYMNPERLISAPRLGGVPIIRHVPMITTTGYWPTRHKTNALDVVIRFDSSGNSTEGVPSETELATLLPKLQGGINYRQARIAEVFFELHNAGLLRTGDKVDVVDVVNLLGRDRDLTDSDAEQLVSCLLTKSMPVLLAGKADPDDPRWCIATRGMGKLVDYLQSPSRSKTVDPDVFLVYGTLLRRLTLDRPGLEDSLSASTLSGLPAPSELDAERAAIQAAWSEPDAVDIRLDRFRLSPDEGHVAACHDAFLGGLLQQSVDITITPELLGFAFSFACYATPSGVSNLLHRAVDLYDKPPAKRHPLVFASAGNWIRPSSSQEYPPSSHVEQLLHLLVEQAAIGQIDKELLKSQFAIVRGWLETPSQTLCKTWLDDARSRMPELHAYLSDLPAAAETDRDLVATARHVSSFLVLISMEELRSSAGMQRVSWHAAIQASSMMAWDHEDRRWPQRLRWQPWQALWTEFLHLDYQQKLTLDEGFWSALALIVSQSSEFGTLSGMSALQRQVQFLTSRFGAVLLVADEHLGPGGDVGGVGLTEREFEVLQHLVVLAQFAADFPSIDAGVLGEGGVDVPDLDIPVPIPPLPQDVDGSGEIDPKGPVAHTLAKFTDLRSGLIAGAEHLGLDVMKPAAWLDADVLFDAGFGMVSADNPVRLHEVLMGLFEGADPWVSAAVDAGGMLAADDVFVTLKKYIRAMDAKDASLGEVEAVGWRLEAKAAPFLAGFEMFCLAASMRRLTLGLADGFDLSDFDEMLSFAEFGLPLIVRAAAAAKAILFVSWEGLELLTKRLGVLGQLVTVAQYSRQLDEDLKRGDDFGATLSGLTVLASGGAVLGGAALLFFGFTPAGWAVVGTLATVSAALEVTRFAVDMLRPDLKTRHLNAVEAVLIRERVLLPDPVRLVLPVSPLDLEPTATRSRVFSWNGSEEVAHLLSEDATPIVDVHGWQRGRLEGDREYSDFWVLSPAFPGQWCGPMTGEIDVVGNVVFGDQFGPVTMDDVDLAYVAKLRKPSVAPMPIFVPIGWRVGDVELLVELGEAVAAGQPLIRLRRSGPVAQDKRLVLDITSPVPGTVIEPLDHGGNVWWPWDGAASTSALVDMALRIRTDPIPWLLTEEGALLMELLGFTHPEAE